MNVVLLNGFYLATDHRIGQWSGSLSNEQKNNANIIRSFFWNDGWTLEAICGMLGNMHGESTLNPAYIQETNRWRLPSSAASLSDVPNSVMKNFYADYYGVAKRAFGIGLVQWDGYSPRGGLERQKLVAYCQDNNIAWYDGWSQCYRIRGEQAYDVTHGPTFFYNVRVSGVQYNFVNYPDSTASPEDLAAAWSYGYERNEAGVGVRGETARLWYDYFTGPDAPDIILPGDFMDPIPDDPDNPPFDPEDPDGPDAPGTASDIKWLIPMLMNKRKKVQKKWIKV